MRTIGMLFWGAMGLLISLIILVFVLRLARGLPLIGGVAGTAANLSGLAA